jgi:predicted nucleic acid-binding Zn ribbon protein
MSSCKHCGKHLKGAANRRYCSDACRMRGYRRRQKGLPLTVPKATRFGLVNMLAAALGGQTRRRVATSEALVASARARIAESQRQVKTARTRVLTASQVLGGGRDLLGS